MNNQFTKKKIEEFRKEFPTDEWIGQNLYTRGDKTLPYGMNDIESFIRQTIQETKEEFKKIVEGVKGEKITEIQTLHSPGSAYERFITTGRTIEECNCSEKILKAIK